MEETNLERLHLKRCEVAELCGEGERCQSVMKMMGSAASPLGSKGRKTAQGVNTYAIFLNAGLYMFQPLPCFLRLF